MSWSGLATASGTLSRTASRRLGQDLRELRKKPLANANAQPIGDDLSRWKCILLLDDGTPVSFTLEFREDYPTSAPLGFFNSPVEYRMGAASRDAKGRLQICLNIFGNFGTIHTEWGSEAAGWSSACTVESVLVQMQALFCSEFMDTSAGARERLRSYEIPMELQVEVLTEEALQSRNASVEDDGGAVEEKVEESTEELEEELARKGLEDLARNFQCYVTKNTILNGHTIGYGLMLKAKKVSSPFEYLSTEAYHGGVRKSATNESLHGFLPLYISPEHWGKVKRNFFTEINRIHKKLAQTKQRSHRSDEMALDVIASLMNQAVVKVCLSKGKGTADDRFIDAYFGLYRLLQQLKIDEPRLVTTVDTRLENFLKDPRNRHKTHVPDLGEWMIYFLISEKYRWSDVAVVFQEELDARNVFWYVKGTARARATCPDLMEPKADVRNRTKRVFDATAVSRHIVCFQVRFMEQVQEMSLEQLDHRYGLPSREVQLQLKEMYREIAAIDNWAAHQKWCHYPVKTDPQRRTQLENSVKLSNAQRYTDGPTGRVGVSQRGGRGGRGRGSRGGGRGRGRGYDLDLDPRDRFYQGRRHV